MIYTVTLNPSVDFIVEVEDFQLDGLNRMSKEAKYPGGKGINVSRILKRIDVDNTALGFYGGFPGEFILDALRKEGVKQISSKLMKTRALTLSLRLDMKPRLTDLVQQSAPIK